MAESCTVEHYCQRLVALSTCSIASENLFENIWTKGESETEGLHFCCNTMAYGKYKTFHICIRHRVSISLGWKYKDILFKDKYKELLVLKYECFSTS